MAARMGWATFRYARAPEAGKVTLEQQLRAEARSIFGIRPRLRLVKLADGAKANWRYLSELDVGIPNDQLEIYEILDYFHACDHLKSALDGVWGENSPKGKAEFARLKTLLKVALRGAKEDDDGVTIVIKGGPAPRWPLRGPLTGRTASRGHHLRYRLRTASGPSQRKLLAKELAYFRNQGHP